MTTCAHDHEPNEHDDQAPLFVPIALILLGLVLLPFDCIYNDILALIIIAIGGWSLFKRGKELRNCLHERKALLARNPQADLPRCI